MRGSPMQVAVNVVGIALMIGLAALLQWFKTVAGRPARRRRAVRTFGVIAMRRAPPSLRPRFVASLAAGRARDARAARAATARCRRRWSRTTRADRRPSASRPRSRYHRRHRRRLDRRHRGRRRRRQQPIPTGSKRRCAGATPASPITVHNKGVPRQTTEDMVDRFDRMSCPANPTLVIWETGTVDAVRGTDVDDFALALERRHCCAAATQF